MGGRTASVFVPVVTTVAALRAAGDACVSGSAVRPAIPLALATAPDAEGPLRRLAQRGHGALLHPAGAAAPPAAWRHAVTHLRGKGIDVSCVLDVAAPDAGAIRSAVAGVGARIAI